MSVSSTGDERAMNILRELLAAEKELVGSAVVLTDGKAGTIDQLFYFTLALSCVLALAFLVASITLP